MYQLLYENLTCFLFNAAIKFFIDLLKYIRGGKKEYKTICIEKEGITGEG